MSDHVKVHLLRKRYMGAIFCFRVSPTLTLSSIEDDHKLGLPECRVMYM